MFVRKSVYKVLTGIAAAFALILFHDVTLAQDDDDSADEFEFEEVGVEEIIVTGSRLRRRDFSAPSPITSRPWALSSAARVVTATVGDGFTRERVWDRKVMGAHNVFVRICTRFCS